MIDKIHKIKQLRLSKEEFDLFSLLEKLEIKKYKNNYFLVSDCIIFCEIDTINGIIWVDYDLFDKNYRNYINWLKVKNAIKKYFNMEIEDYNIFSYSALYNKKIYYLGKPRRINNIYKFIWILKKNKLSL